jgi:hypothetical protein
MALGKAEFLGGTSGSQSKTIPYDPSLLQRASA